MLIGYISSVCMFYLPNIEKNNHYSREIPFISIIIPARNEEKRLPALMKSIKKQQFKNYEVIVVDDNSDDDTSSVAKHYGADVIHAQPINDMPPGKQRACASGAIRAQGEWLLFLDADVKLVTEHSLEQFLSTYRAYQCKGILSLQPYHEIGKFYENLSAVFSVIVIAGMNAFSIWRDKFKTAGSFGPVILCDRISYFQSGGHEAAEDSIMDDFALSDLFTRNHLPVNNILGYGYFTLRMYPEGIKSLIEGWTKNLATASQSTHPFIMMLVIFWVLGGLISIIPFLSAVIYGDVILIIIAFSAYILFGISVYRRVHGAGDFSRWTILIYPLFFMFFVFIYSYSFFRTHVLKSVKWKGRNIKL